MNIPDNPVIRQTELNGDGEEAELLTCPICGETQVDKLFFSIPHKEIVGCEFCIKERTYYD